MHDFAIMHSKLVVFGAGPPHSDSAFSFGTGVTLRAEGSSSVSVAHSFSVNHIAWRNAQRKRAWLIRLKRLVFQCKSGQLNACVA